MVTHLFCGGKPARQAFFVQVRACFAQLAPERLQRRAAADVLYADTADKKTFLYTADAVYETPLRLYELEEQLAARDFVRAGKSVLLNFAHVAALRPDFGGRMRVTMSNGEVVVASRQYVPALKAKLGL